MVRLYTTHPTRPNSHHNPHNQKGRTAAAPSAAWVSGPRGSQQRRPSGNGIHLSLSRTAVATAAALGGFGVLSGVHGGGSGGVGQQWGVTTMSAATAAGQGPEGATGNALLEQVGWSCGGTRSCVYNGRLEELLRRPHQTTL